MQNKTAHSLSRIRQANTYTILQALLQARKPVEISQLSASVSLSRPTVNVVLQSLAQVNLLSTNRQLPSSGTGRPVTTYQLDTERIGYLVMRIGYWNFEASIVCLNGQTKQTVTYEIDRSSSVIDQIIGSVRILLSDSNFQVLAATLTTIGVVQNNQVIGSYRHPEIAQPNALERVREALRQSNCSCPLDILNDAKVSARQLFSMVHGKSVDSALTFFVSNVLSVGIIVNGQVLDGEHGAAGEVAIKPDDAWAHVNNALENAYKTFHNDIFSLSAEGDSQALAIAHDVLTNIAQAALPLIYALDPTYVLFGGDICVTPSLVNDVFQPALDLPKFFNPRSVVISQSKRAIFEGSQAYAHERAVQRLVEKILNNSGENCC